MTHVASYMDKQNDFIQTVNGKCIDFLNPKPEDFEIETIAHALSLLCRFGGHCKTFYSVGEHSVRCFYEAQDRGLSEELQREALLHDASEAYLVDMPRPIKYVLTQYREIEDGLDKNIRKRFNLPEKISPEIKLIDNVLLATEKRDIMNESEQPWMPLPDPSPWTITPWSHGTAKKEFLANARIFGL